MKKVRNTSVDNLMMQHDFCIVTSLIGSVTRPICGEVTNTGCHFFDMSEILKLKSIGYRKPEFDV